MRLNIPGKKFVVIASFFAPSHEVIKKEFDRTIEAVKYAEKNNLRIFRAQHIHRKVD